MKKLLLLALLCLGAGIFSRGASAQATLNLSDCSQSALQAAWNQMSSGAYILVFPSCAAGGTGTWTSQLSLTEPSGVTSLTVQGNTSVTCTGTFGASNYTCSATDSTIIEDGDTNANDSILRLTLNGSTFRMTGITLKPASTTSSKSNGIFLFTGNTTQFRWDHSDIIVNDNDDAGPQFSGQIEGVLDHDVLNGGDATSFVNIVRIDNDLFDTVGNGDGGWMAATQFGSQHFIFLESSYIVGGYTSDCTNAGRFVMRYNTFYDMQDASGAVHSTKDYGGPVRGCRVEEFYHNYISGPGGGYTATGGEGASLLSWGNILGNLDDSWFYAGGLYRNETTVNGAPNNSGPPNGWSWCGTTVASYFASQGEVGNPASTWDGNSNTASGYPCLDGLGRGQQTQAMNGANFPARANTVTGGQTWPHQYLEPMYFFDNTLPSGMAGEVLLTDVSTALNRDVYQDCGSYNSSCSGGFTGAAGTGYGALSARPSTCTAGPGGTYYTSPTGSYGVAYWATDMNSGAGELYVCTSTNTWTATYTPYTYPHPLVSGGGGGGGGGGSTLNPPTISPASGNYSSPQTVTITPPTGASACYRTDGNAPTASTPGACDAGSTTYSGPFSLTIPTAGAVVQAISTESGQTNSSVATASYTLQTCNQTLLSGNWTCLSDATNSTSSSGTSVTAGPFSVNAPAASLILVFQLNGSNAACAAPTDTLGNPATAISTATIAADSFVICDYYMVVGAGGADAVTCHTAATTSLISCNAVNVTGQAVSAIVDQACTRSNALTASGINNMTCANSITVGTPNELVVAAAFGDYGVRSAGTNFTMIDSNNWSGEYFMEATPMIWTPAETISASGLNYGLLAVSLAPYNSQTPQAPTGLAATVQ